MISFHRNVGDSRWAIHLWLTPPPLALSSDSEDQMMYHTTTEPMWAPHTKAPKLRVNGRRGKEKARNLRTFRTRGLAIRLGDRHS